MNARNDCLAARPGVSWMPWALWPAAALLATLAQLAQARLWPSAVYAAMAAGAVVIAALVLGVWFMLGGSHRGPKLRPLWVSWIWTAALVCAWGLLVFAQAGWRASQMTQEVGREWEGQDVDVQGVITSLPQVQAGWVRVEFRVEAAWEAVPLVQNLPGEKSPVRLAVTQRFPQTLWVIWPLAQSQAWAHDEWAPVPDAAMADALGAQGLVPGLTPSSPLVAGDRWRWRLRIKAVHGLRNPYGFDSELSAWQRGLRYTGTVRGGRTDPLPVRLGASGSAGLARLRQGVREDIARTLAARPQEPAEPHSAPAELHSTPAASQRAAHIGLITGLVLGDQNAIGRAEWDLFRRTGVAHLVSISGLHITGFAIVAYALLRRLWRWTARWGWPLCLWWPAPRAASFMGFALAALYAAFSGWGVPAERTVWMLAWALVLRSLGLRWPWSLTVLGVAAFMALLDPWALLQAGFWLSFVAVSVLLAGSERDRHALETGNPFEVDPAPEPSAWGPAGHTQHSIWRQQALQAWRTLCRWGLGLLREQLRMSLVLAPLSLFFFAQVSLVGLLANLFAIPWMTLLITPLCLLGLMVPVAWLWADALLAPGLALLSFMGQWPGAVGYAPAPTLWMVLVATLGAALAAVAPSLRWRGLGLVLCAGVWVCLSASPRSTGVWEQTLTPGHFALHILDVGQGNALLVQTQHHVLLYDTGPRYGSSSDAGERVIVPYLRGLGLPLDALVLSHSDSDHTGGAEAVLSAFAPQQVFSSLPADHALLKRMRPGAHQPCAQGLQWQWDGVQFRFLHPQSAEPTGRSKPNARSCVLHIEGTRDGSAEKRVGKWAGTDVQAVPQSALLAADIEADQENQILAAWKRSRTAPWIETAVQQAVSSVPASAPTPAPPSVWPQTRDMAFLLMPHHGSTTSSTPGFIAELAPRLAWVQAGYRNRYGHPAPDVMARYHEAGVTVVESVDCGAGFWVSTAPERWRCERQERRHYWQHER